MSSAPLALVTGAAGWLGRRLVDVLANGLSERPELRDPNLKIRAFVLPGEEAALAPWAGDRLEVVVGDLRDASSVERFVQNARGAVLYHTAGMIHPGRVREFEEVNVGGTKNVLEAAVKSGVRRAVVVSSNSPIGTNPTHTDVFDESSPYNPYMGYGRSKMHMELFVKAVQAEGRIDTVLIRPPWFYGPFQPPRQTLFFEMIRDGKGPIVGSGENRRSMAYIDNLCQGLMLAAKVDGAAGQTYWIADERPYTMNEILDTVERLLESEFQIPCAHKRLRLPGFASAVAYGVDAMLQGMGLYQQKIHVLSEMNKTIACTVEKAKAELGYRPTVALEEGMRRSIAWCIEQKLLGPKP